MSAWVAGVSFLAANMGALELMGWAAAAYQYGFLAAHWYWIGAVPAMLFLALVMMPFYYISRTHSVPGYLKLRFGEPTRALSAFSFAGMTILMSGINMFAMAKVMEVVLGWNLTFSILVSSVTVAVYVTLGGLRSAILNEVLQFFLIWAGALVIPILGLIETGGWSGLKQRILANAAAGLTGNSGYLHLWTTLGHFKGNSMGVHWTGIVFGLGFVGGLGYWTTDFLVVQRILAAKDLRSSQMAPIIGAWFKMAVPVIVILPGLIGLAVLPNAGLALVGEGAARAGQHTYNEVLPLLLIRYAGPGLLGLGITALIAGFMSGMAGNVSAFSAVWSYDIYRPLLRPQSTDEHMLQGRPLEHHPRRPRLHRHRLLRHALLLHHGVRASALLLLRHAALRHSHPRHAVEARHRSGGLLGTARRHRILHRHVGLGAGAALRPQAPRALARRAAHGRDPLSHALVLAPLRHRHRRRQPHHPPPTGRIPQRPRLRLHRDARGETLPTRPAARLLGRSRCPRLPLAAMALPMRHAHHA